MAVLVWNEFFNIRAAVDVKELNQNRSANIGQQGHSYLVDFDLSLGVASSFTVHAYSFGARVYICNALYIV